MNLFGIHFLGFTTTNLHKLVLSLAFVVGIVVLRAIVVGTVRLFTGHPNARVAAT